MRLKNLILVALLVWFGLEVLAFALVVHEAGLDGAILLGLVTTIAGFSILRRAGLSAALALRDGFQKNIPNKLIFSGDAIRNGSLATFGAVLLILPGFISDLIGFCLVTPAAQVFFSKLIFSRFGFVKKTSQSNPQVVDLSPQEWSRVEETRQN